MSSNQKNETRDMMRFFNPIEVGKHGVAVVIVEDPDLEARYYAVTLHGRIYHTPETLAESMKAAERLDWTAKAAARCGSEQTGNGTAAYRAFVAASPVRTPATSIAAAFGWTPEREAAATKEREALRSLAEMAARLVALRTA